MKAACIASRTGLLPRKEKDTLERPPLVRQPATFFDFLDGIDEVHSIVIMLLHTSGDSEDIEVEDDILRIHADLFGQNLKGALGDADFFVFRRGLSFLVKGHDDNGGSVAHDFLGLSTELVFAPFETD